MLRHFFVVHVAFLTLLALSPTGCHGFQIPTRSNYEHDISVFVYVETSPFGALYKRRRATHKSA